MQYIKHQLKQWVATSTADWKKGLDMAFRLLKKVSLRKTLRTGNNGPLKWLMIKVSFLTILLSSPAGLQEKVDNFAFFLLSSQQGVNAHNYASFFGGLFAVAPT